MLWSPSPCLAWPDRHPPTSSAIGTTKALDFVVSHKMLPPPAERIVAMTQLAMFDAVNSIERKYRPYLVQLAAAPTASKEAAAAAAAATVLAGVDPQTQDRDKSRPCGLSRRHSRQCRQGRRHRARRSGRRQDPGGARQRRRQRAGHLPAADRGRRLCADGADRDAAVARRQAIRLDQRVAVPARGRRSP